MGTVKDVNVAVADAIVALLKDAKPKDRFMTLVIAVNMAMADGTLKMKVGQVKDHPEIVALLRGAGKPKGEDDGEGEGAEDVRGEPGGGTG